ncbi:MAG: EsaB/YukD family protein [Lachnospiraceae bacterium]|nr:EsaB/YukD family protein [Lachnospiraceae bacterium]
MIMVDVYVPSYDKTYDMGLDENLTISLLLEEISNVICQKEMAKIKGMPDELCLCSFAKEEIFSPERCLRDYGITNGCRLLLV